MRSGNRLVCLLGGAHSLCERLLKQEAKPDQKEINMKSELKEKLTQLTFNRSLPFCYGCYQKCPAGRCEKCVFDNLMRMVHGVSCKYGTD